MGVETLRGAGFSASDRSADRRGRPGSLRDIVRPRARGRAAEINLTEDLRLVGATAFGVAARLNSVTDLCHGLVSHAQRRLRL